MLYPSALISLQGPKNFRSRGRIEDDDGGDNSAQMPRSVHASPSDDRITRATRRVFMRVSTPRSMHSKKIARGTASAHATTHPDAAN
jgi:hypothetical protein